MSAGAQAAAKAASKVAEQSVKQNQVAQTIQPGQQSPFQTLMQNQDTKVSEMGQDMLKSFGYENNVHPAENAVSATDAQIQISDVQKLDSTQSTDTITTALMKVNRGGLQMGRMMEMVSSGSKFSNRELLLLQGSMHQLTFEAEIAVRSMDAFKSVIQTLVQRSMNG